MLPPSHKLWNISENIQNLSLLAHAAQCAVIAVFTILAIGIFGCVTRALITFATKVTISTVIAGILQLTTPLANKLEFKSKTEKSCFNKEKEVISCMMSLLRWKTLRWIIYEIM